MQKAHDPKEAEHKIENVKEFIQSCYNFESTSTANSSIQTLENFLQEISLMQEKMNDKKNDDNAVQCMTLHAAKGLEFDNVLITGLEEGLLPSYRSLNTSQALEEERRLFYVGITRARERLILLRANCRSTFGQINDQVISRFLTEIPDKLTQSIDVSQSTTTQINSLFKNWLKINNPANVLTCNDFAHKATSKIKNTFTKPKTMKNTCGWKKNQLISHKKFGAGIVKKVERKTENEYYITATFKCGQKKILSSFLQHIS